MKKEFGKYYLGLDIGTNSIGWAVTDPEYNILKFNGKSMWGIRLFENANTAAERRAFRTARRRLDRRNDRLAILQELFSEEISKVDPAFYQRMKESKFYSEDKKVDGIYALFSDDNYNDVDFYKAYPTIYHLRKELIEGTKKYDIRLVYLAIHHILKHRGHFLFPAQNMSRVADFSAVYKTFKDVLYDEFDIDINLSDSKVLADILKDRSLGKIKKQECIVDAVEVDLEKQKQFKCIAKLISGGKVKLSDLFDNFGEGDKQSICFSDSKWDEEWVELQDVLGDNSFAIETLKSIYDWSILSEILNGEQYLSMAKVAVYQKHAQDLQLLKKYVKKLCPNKFKEIFNESKKSVDNYVAYSRCYSSNGKKKKLNYVCKSNEDFCKYILSVFKNCSCEDVEYQNMILDLSNGTFMPKQVSVNNSVIPYQAHKEELVKILDNASRYYSFLKDKDSSGLTVAEKVISLLTFRIPYYVGPLNNSHQELCNGHAWIIRKESGKVYPWNFEQKVDVNASAEKFIMRMTNKCTYLIGEDVLPKNSIIYSKFTVLNELNNLRINQEKISVQLKQAIFNDLFLTKKKVTQKDLIVYLKKKTGFNLNYDTISGIDGDFKSNMASYIDMSRIFDDIDRNIDIVEDIIRYIVLFGDSGTMLKDTISRKYKGVVTDAQITQILSKKYSGWGRLSKTFLCDITTPNKFTGEFLSIISAMWTDESNPNLMQLLSSEYEYSAKIEGFNSQFGTNNKLEYDDVEKLYASPAVKRMLWQTILITQELVKVTGHNPEKVFIEMARSDDEKKVRKESRKKHLLDLYKSCKNDERNWAVEIDGYEESNFRQDRLYLYYTQMGKCMYSGDSIDIQDLFNENIYDIDHIYPQSKCKDDSIDNRVLVKKILNVEKGNNYPIKQEWQNNNIELWKHLLSTGLISKKKYDRLTRRTQLSNEELSSFVERQIVETRQTCKAAAQLLDRCLSSEIVYVKAGNISKFRQEFDLIKCREVNDYHHAHDAYLNIVVGNVYYTKFTLSPANFIKDSKFKYNLARMYEYNIERNGVVAWCVDNNKTISTVKQALKNNNVQYTRLSYIGKGALFDQQLVAPKEKLQPIKQSDARLADVRKYGGYNSVKLAYFVLARYSVKNRTVMSLEPIPVYIHNMAIHNPNAVIKYLQNKLQVENVEMIIDKIKLSSLIEHDGYRAHIVGGTSQIEVKNANQLIINPELYKYAKEISNYINRCKDSNIKIGEMPASKMKSITAEKNKELYSAIRAKMQSGVFSRFYSGTVANSIINGYEKFNNLIIEQQLVTLYDILNILHCSPTRGSLKTIGGADDVGRVFISRKISSGKSLYLVNQSVTGLFEQRIDLSIL